MQFTVVAQKGKYYLKEGDMYISIEKKINQKELNDFIRQYDLKELSLPKLLESNNDDSLKLAGWSVATNSKTLLLIKKTLQPLDDISNTTYRVKVSSASASSSARFPSVNNSVVYGINHFKTKNSFIVADSTVIFNLNDYLLAKKVVLSGSFNNWNPDSILMQKTNTGWTTTMKLTPGKYWYKFVIDGKWITDPDNRLTENDGEGFINSVFYVTNHTFFLPGYSKAKKVLLAGSFNNWDSWLFKSIPLDKTNTGWIKNVYLAEGTHTYRFIINKKWIEDPNSQKLPNEYGEFNSYLTIGKPFYFLLKGFPNAGKVILSGSFNHWRTDELYMQKTDSGWHLPYVLGPGNYSYKFIVDGLTVIDSTGKQISSKDENITTLIIEPNFTFNLKGYSDAKNVYLAGDFNQWDTHSLPMNKTKDGWEIRVNLSLGKHLYKFIVDGNWILDPNNTLWEQNFNRTGNSVLWLEKF
ncbi:MAG: hypothetical protein IPH58_00185 [Sphingobacteriales bacterium]|nr:hypothetical protein [Sphingobacteriales bacterium]